MAVTPLAARVPVWKRALVIFAAGVIRASVGAEGQAPLPPLAVHQAVPEAATDTLTIDGEHFGPAPFVTLDLVPLDLRLALDTRIMAVVPVDKMPPGTYLLTVSRGPAQVDRATIDVTIGRPSPAVSPAAPSAPAAAGASPTTPAPTMPAPTTPAAAARVPAPGEPAAIVGDRTLTVADVDRQWLATDPGSYLALMRQLHEQRRRIADQMATAALLAREAESRQTTVDALLADEVPKRVIAMPDTALTALYESLGERTRGAPLEKMRPALRAWLERKTEPELAKMAYVEELVKTSTWKEIVLLGPAVTVERSPRDPVRGSTSAAVVLDVFGDLQSPDYVRLARAFDRVVETYGARVGLVFKLLPAFGEPSALVAEAGACAHAQGRFWPFHDSAARPAVLDARRLKAIPDEAGLDQRAFDQCVRDGAFRDRARDAAAEAARYGLSVTPSVLVNGRLAPAPPPFLPAYEYLTRLIEEELQRLARAARPGRP